MTKISDEAPLPWKYVGGGVVEDANGRDVLHMNMRFNKRDGGYPAGEDLIRRITMHDDLVAADKYLGIAHTRLANVLAPNGALVAALQAAYDHLSDVVPEDEPLVVQISAALAKAHETFETFYGSPAWNLPTLTKARSDSDGS